MNVLLVGHTCSPSRGSEPGVAWNWAWELSKLCDVWLLAHPVYRDEVERFLVESPNPKLHLVWVMLPSILDPWKPSKGLRFGRPHYVLWSRAALQAARRLCRQVEFDIVHHVSWNSVSSPPPYWRLGIPFVWGPVGGGQIPPASFKEYFGRSWRGEQIRRWRVQLLPYVPPLRRTVEASSLILASNTETAALLKRAGARQVELYTDAGIPPGFLSKKEECPRRNGDLTLLWVGALEPHKCPQLALEALADAPDLRAQLIVVGDGTLRRDMMYAAQALGIQEKVHFQGNVARDQLKTYYRSADAFLFTSLRDSSGTVLVEAMGHSLPVIAPNHQGAAVIVPDSAGIKVPVTTPSQTVKALTEALRTLAASAAVRRAMSLDAYRAAQGHAWPEKARAMYDRYVRILG